MCSRQCPTPGPSFPPNNLCWSQCPPCHLFPLLPRFVSPQFVAEPPLLLRFSPQLVGQNFPSKFPPLLLNLWQNPLTLSLSAPCQTLYSEQCDTSQLPQWRYECFSDVINTHSGGKAGPKIFSRKFLEFPPVLAPPPRCRGRASKPDFSSSNFHRPPSRGAQYFFVPRVMAQSTKL